MAGTHTLTPCPPDVLNAVLADPTAYRLAHLSGLSPGDLRSDLGHLVMVALEAWVNVPVRAVPRILDLDSATVPTPVPARP